MKFVNFFIIIIIATPFAAAAAAVVVVIFIGFPWLNCTSQSNISICVAYALQRISNELNNNKMKRNAKYIHTIASAT